jgi:CRISPR/Cas system CMR subunit Cmr4 (Cas7 group RAMP superfamily)
MTTVELRKVIKFKSYRQTTKTDLKIKKIQQIDQLFHEEICVFQTAEFQKLHNTMSNSRKKLFAEWAKVLRQIVQFENRMEEIEKRMVLYENNANEKYIHNKTNRSDSCKCNENFLDCIANT